MNLHKLSAVFVANMRTANIGAMKLYGLSLQPDQLLGEFLRIPGVGDLHRQAKFRWADMVDATALVYEMWREIATNYGPGRVWVLGDMVHLVSDDGMYSTAANGQAYFRLWYAHENQIAKPKTKTPPGDPAWGEESL